MLKYDLLTLLASENGMTLHPEVMSADVSLQNVHHTSPLNVCKSSLCVKQRNL